MTNEAKTDWRVSHTENQGRMTVIVDESQDPDDSDGLVIRISGRTHEKFAERLAALLQQEGVPGRQA